MFYIERTGPVLDRTLNLERPLADCARANLYVTSSGMWNETYLRRCLNIVGPDRLLFSTDYPYQYRPGGEPRRFLESIEIEPAILQAFASANWERLITGDTR